MLVISIVSLARFGPWIDSLSDATRFRNEQGQATEDLAMAHTRKIAMTPDGFPLQYHDN